MRSSTADRSAAIRATSRCAGSSSTSAARPSSTYGSSSRPIRSLASSTRRTLASSVAGSTVPRARPAGRWAYAGSVIAISMSRPASIARAAASGRSAAKPWVSRLRAALASLTTNPSKPQRSRSTSVKSQRLPVAGMPLSVMYAVITLPAPASTAARNGGK